MADLLASKLAFEFGKRQPAKRFQAHCAPVYTMLQRMLWAAVLLNALIDRLIRSPR